MRSPTLILFTLLTMNCFAQLSTKGLVASYNFDNNAIDRSGNGNDGEILGGVTPATDRFGNTAGALHFNGTDAFISIPNSQTLQSLKGSMTVITWFKVEKDPNVNEARLVVFSKGSTLTGTDTKPGYHVQYTQSFINAIGKVIFCCEVTGDDKEYQSHRINFGEWYFFAMVYDESWVQAYLNGKLIWQDIYTKPVPVNDYPLDIGRDLWGGAKHYYRGSLDDLRIYNRGLNATEIESIFQKDLVKDYNAEPEITNNKPAVKSTNNALQANENTETVTATPNMEKPIAPAANGGQATPVTPTGNKQSQPEAPAKPDKPTTENVTDNTITRPPAAEPPKPKPQPVPTPKPFDIFCTPDVVKLSEKGKCGSVVHYTAPKIKGQSIKLTQTEGKPSGDFFPLGLTHNAFTATDPTGYVKQCNFNIKVTDTEPPVVNCPTDSTIILSKNRKGVIFNYEPLKVSDNCGIDTIIQIAGSKPGCFLPIGVHPFIYNVIDKAGNKQLCSYTVTVKNTEVAEKLAVPNELDKTLGTDSIHYEHHAQVENCLLTIYMYDDGEEDGDSVSVIFDGQVIVDHEMIRNKEHGVIKRQLVLLNGNENYIITKAWNTGRVGLNTLKIDIYEGDIENDRKDLRNRKPVLSKVMHSKPGAASGFILTCKEE